MKKIVIFGAGGHASVIVDLIENAGQYEIEALVVSEIPKGVKDGSKQWGYPLVSEKAYLAGGYALRGIVGVGDNFLREKIVKKTESRFPHFDWVTLVHSSAVLSQRVVYGGGTVVMAGAVLQCRVELGAHCVVNSASVLDHDVVLGDFASVAPGAVLGGGVKVGASSAIGLGACVHEKCTIGAETLIGGGALVSKDIPARKVAFGVPCRIVRSRMPGEPYLK